jgi:hypothetical protein
MHRSAIALCTLTVLLGAAAAAGQPPETPEPPAEGVEEEAAAERVEPTPAAPAGDEPAAAPEAAEDDGAEPPADDAAAAEETEAAAAERPSRDLCEVAAPADEPRLDQLRREMFETVCESARWFDGFFGSQRYDEEARKTRGRAQLRVVYDEYDDWEIDGRFRARYELPNLDRRVNAFLGREDEEEFISGTDDTFRFLPDFFRGEGREEWIVGLGYRPVSGDRRQTDFDVGVDVDTPLEPFARGRYRQYWLVGDRNLLRAQQSLYWTSQRGFGATTHFDAERPVGDQFLMRWSNRGTIDEESAGVDWFTGVTLYHGFGPDQAIALSLAAEGATDHDVGLHEYGSRVTYRRRMLREWFFGELIGGVSWPRESLLEDRDMAWHFGFGFEIQFSGEDLGVGAGPSTRLP